MWVISLLECSDRLVLPGCVIFPALPVSLLQGKAFSMSYKVTRLSDSAHTPKAEDCKHEREYELKESICLLYMIN